MSMHKATPLNDTTNGVATCMHCGQNIRIVPGGQGPTWVHDDGHVAAKDRPADIRGILVEVAEWMDLADRAFAKLAEIQGKGYDPTRPANRTVQGDLRRLAQYFASYPDMDREVYEAVFPSSTFPEIAACSTCGARWPKTVLDNFGRCAICGLDDAYVATHRSKHDGSEAMLLHISKHDGLGDEIVLRNENGDEWPDLATEWEPL